MEAILVYLTQYQYVNVALAVLGSLVVIGTALSGFNKAVKSFMDKVKAIPVLGQLLSFAEKFSPFNYKPKA